MKTFPKKYDHKQEMALYEKWNDAGLFDPDIVFKKRASLGYENKDEQFMIPLPPPNVTGRLHIGHSMMATVEDILVRYFRMNGYKTLWIPGTDHAAIATNAVVEKRLASYGKTRFDLGRDGFLTEVRKRVEEHRGHISGQLKCMGASLDRQREQYTMSESLSRSVRKAFKQLYEKGRIYQDYYVVNRSPAAESVVSDIEVDFKEEEEKLYYVRYFVDTKKHVMIVATTRPETIFADVALAVNPLDKRYKKLIGKKVIIPIINRTIPIIADEYVDMTFGTGALKITPAHDPNDFDIAKKHQLPLDVFAFNRDEIFTEQAGHLFVNKRVGEFRENVIQYLKDIGNLEKVEAYTHRVPYCSRTGSKIQPFLSKQWFMDVQHGADKLLYHLDEEHIGVYPERFIGIFRQWLEKIKPWCISRQVWRGHRLPVWHGEGSSTHVMDEDNVLEAYARYAQMGKLRGKKQTEIKTGNVLFAMILFNLVADNRLSSTFHSDQLIDILFGASLTAQYGRVIERYLAIYSDSQLQKKISESVGEKQYKSDLKTLKTMLKEFVKQKQSLDCGEMLIDMLDQSFLVVQTNAHHYMFDVDRLVQGDGGLKQDRDTLDTWFSSALWPFSILGRPEETVDLKNYFPNTVLETGYDIILFWVIKMMIMGVEIMHELPFKHVYLHGMVKDTKGKKMSKSDGNIVDPLGIIDKYGADALRLSLIVGSTPGNDISYNEEKTKYYWRFINKLWNASRFVMKSIGDKKIPFDLLKLGKKIFKEHESLHDFDLWALHMLNDTIDESAKCFERFNLGEGAHGVVQSLWQYFCDRYIEISKVYQSELTGHVLIYILGRLLQLLHPYTPFVTEKLWQQIGFVDSISVSDWPKTIMLPHKNYKIKLMMDMITQLRTLKLQVVTKPHEKVEGLVQASSDIVDYIQEFEVMIKKLVNISTLHYFREGQVLPEGFTTGVVINITLGVKGVHVVDKQEKIKELEKELGQEEVFLQSLRQTLSNESFVSKAPKVVLKAKQDKVDEVKSNITQLEMEIKRLKSH